MELLHGKAVLRPDPAGSGIEWPIWWMTFLSLSCLSLAIGFGRQFILIFLVVWTFYLLAWPTRGINQILSSPLPLCFPLLAFTSVLWSHAPIPTLRNAAQLLLVTAISTLIARAQNARSFISAFMCGMVLSVIIGTIFGGKAVVGNTNEMALTGIFGSKNNFALNISLMILSCASVIINPKQPTLLRILGIAGCLIGPPLLVMAKSLGAMVTLVIALGCLLGFSLAGRMSAWMRPVFYTGIAFLLLAGLGILVILQSSGMLEAWLYSAGKDTTLTGRTYLWSRAESLIPLNPVLGVGFQAFWRQEFLEAEGFWRFAGITSRQGFHFHNLYYETAVELGYVGVAVLGMTLVMLAIKTFMAAFRQPHPEHAFFVALIVILASRAYVELDFLSPYVIGSLLIPIIWTYATRLETPYRGAAARPRLPTALRSQAAG